jgi:hypothetical protein
MLVAAMLLGICTFTNTVMGQTWNIGNPGYNSNVKATLSGNTLTIGGNGNMCDFWDSTEGEAPWWFNTAHRNAIQTVIIQNGVTNIGNRAFKDCSNLRTITIPNTVTIIGRQAFLNCTNSNFTQVIIPNGVTEIKREAFRNCTYLKEVEIENGSSQLNFTGYRYASLGEFSNVYDWFLNCPNLQTLHLGRNIINSTSNAYIPFRAKTSLTTLTVGSYVSSISSNAFYGCNGLTTITSQNPTPPTVGNNCFTGVNKTTCIVNVPSGSKCAYKWASQWKDFVNILDGTNTQCTTGIDEIAASQLNIFPNPVKDEIFIQSDLQIEKVEIYSLSGNLIISENNFNEKMSVSALPQGIYLLKVYTDKGSMVSKIVKE